MPSVTVHLRLAERVLDHWRGYPDDAPFSPSDPGAANAFRQGAFGPDLGYVPSGPRPLSDLAHCVSSGNLCRALVDAARAPHELGWAWGWVAHVLADTLIHPLVGCAVGELTLGSPGRFIDGDRDPVAHVRVEAGLDAIVAERHPELRALPLGPVFRRDAIGFLTDAFEVVYGVALDGDALHRAHRNAARRMVQGLGLAAFTAWFLPAESRSPLRTGDADGAGPVSRIRAHLGASSVPLAYLFPVTPPMWFLEAVRDVEEQFVEAFLEIQRVGARNVPNLNLDTGRHEELESGHGGMRRALAWLDAEGVTRPSGLRTIEAA